MDAEMKRKVLDKLHEIGHGERSRVVLYVANQDETKYEEYHPSQFSSRTEFRKALIRQQREIGHDALEVLTGRLQKLDLKIMPALLSQAVVVEGPIEDLERAMSEPEVTDAVPDLPSHLPKTDRREEPPTE